MQLKEYFERVLLTILHLQFSIRNPLKDKNELLHMMKILLDEDDNSLLKRQLKRISNVGIEHIKQDEEGFKINFNEFFSSYVSNDFNMKDTLQEQIHNESALLELNITLMDYNKRTKLKKESIEKILLYNKKSVESSIWSECEKYNIEELLITVYLIADKLSILSSIVYSRLKLKEKIEFNNQKDDTMTLLAETLVSMNDNELLLISAFIGDQKLYCDTLFNIIYTKYIAMESQQLECPEPVDILSLFSKVTFWCKMDMLLESTALLYERNQYLYMENLIINPSGNFQDKLLSFMRETLQNAVGDELISNLQDMYRRFEGFTSNNLMELIRYLQKEQEARNLNGTELEIFPVEKLKYVVKNSCDIAEFGIDKLLDSITLKDSTREGKDYKNKISIRPLVKLKNERIILTIPLLLQAYPLLNKRMLQQSFTQNKRLQKYFKKNYDEVYIGKIADELKIRNIMYWKNLNLDKVANKQVKALFVKGITREIDLVFINNNVFYFVEYKNWGTTAFSIRNMLKEYKKVENCVKQHFAAMRIVEENKDAYRSIFGEIIDGIHKICLIMVFQKPNAFEYLNTNEDVKVLSLNDCLCKIKNNEL